MFEYSYRVYVKDLYSKVHKNDPRLFVKEKTKTRHRARCRDPFNW